MEDLSEPLLSPTQQQRQQTSNKHGSDGPEIVDLGNDINNNSSKNVEDHSLGSNDDNESTEDCLLFLQDLRIRRIILRVAVALFQLVWPDFVWRTVSPYLFRGVLPFWAAFGLVLLGNMIVLGLWYQYLRHNNQNQFPSRLVFVCGDCAPTIFWWLLGSADVFFFEYSAEPPLGFVVLLSCICWFLVLAVQFCHSQWQKLAGMMTRSRFGQMEDRYFAEIAAREEQEQQQLEAQQERLKLVLESSRNTKSSKRRRSSGYRLLLIVLLGLSVLWQVFSISPFGATGQAIEDLSFILETIRSETPSLQAIKAVSAMHETHRKQSQQPAPPVVVCNNCGKK